MVAGEACGQPHRMWVKRHGVASVSSTKVSHCRAVACLRRAESSCDAPSCGLWSCPPNSLKIGLRQAKALRETSNRWKIARGKFQRLETSSVAHSAPSAIFPDQGRVTRNRMNRCVAMTVSETVTVRGFTPTSCTFTAPPQLPAMFVARPVHTALLLVALAPSTQ